MKNLICVSVLMITFTSIAESNSKPALKFFSPGQYHLKEGKMEKCGDGEFLLRDNKTNVGLGYLHGYDLDNKTGDMTADPSDDDQDCKYHYKDQVENKSDRSVITFHEEKICDHEVEHTLNETAQIQANEIRLDVVQTGDERFHYSCVWTKSPSHPAIKQQAKKDDHSA